MSRRPPSLPPEDTPAPGPGDPTPVQHRLGAHRDFTAANPPDEVGTPDPNDVFVVRKMNLAVERAHTDELLPPVDRTPKRRHARDYWLIMLIGNGTLGLAAWLMPNVMVVVYAGSGMVILTLSVTWLYWFVLDPR